MSQAQRTAADPAISAFVTANAGSGKTKTLIDRTARLLLKDARPQTILCVTYTKAAAAEMQRRLFDLMGDWSVMEDEPLRDKLADLEGRAIDSFTDADLSRARRLFAQALETPGGLKIQTIHAFCERLLRRFPLEAGISPGFEVIDDGAAAAIAAEARAGVAELALSGKLAAVSEAYAAFSVALDFQSFQNMFAAFEAERGAIAAYVESVGGLAGLPDAIADVCGLDGMEDAAEIEEEAVLPPELEPSRWFAAAKALAQGSDGDQKCGLVYQAVAEAALRGEPMVDKVRVLFFTDKGEMRKRLATKAIDPAVCEWLAEEQRRVAAAMERARAARVAADTVRALTLAWVYAGLYERAKTARGVLDFSDLITRTAALLRDAPAAAWVLYKLDGGIDHILLDEAQDTAPDQWEILRRLTGEFFSGAGRPADRAIDRTLFVVGDEKQSIYSFQGAAPERLLHERRAYMDAIGPDRSKAPELFESWRSVQDVLRFVDTVFQPPEMLGAIMPGGGDILRHVPMREGHRGCVDLWEPEQEEKEAERDAWTDPLDAISPMSANRRLANRIADEIEALVRRGDGVFDKDARVWRPAQFGDVLILVRRRGALFEDILRALKQRGLPVAGADRLALSEHIAFDDLLALARFVLFPKDDLTLAALLKSPFCGLDDDSLYALAHGRGARPLWDVLTARRGEQAVWAEAHDLLVQAIAEGRARRPFDFYGRTLSRLDGQRRSMRARFLTRLGAEATDALDEFMAQVAAAEQRGVRDLESLAAALAALDIMVKREMDRGAGEVRVMTAHGAKGLEAPIVFLPEMTLAGGARGGPLLKTSDGGFLWCSSTSGDCGASTLARTLRKDRESQESQRLLYVALTRARDRLVLCGRISATARRENVGGWYAAAEAALAHTDLAADVRQMEGPGGLAVRRYGPDPRPATTASPSMAPDDTSLPAWLNTLPKAEPSGVRHVSPSALAERTGDAAASPLDSVRGLGRFRRGSLIHRLLQLLPDLPTAARKAAAHALLAREPDLDEAQRAEMAAAALTVLEDPRFAPVFGPGSRAEAALAGRGAGLPERLAISGRVDRLVIEPDRILVVDFKTNRPSPDAIEDADPAYIRQMALYAAVLGAAFPGRRIEAALVWTDGPKLMPVPENLIADALAQVADAP